MGRRQSGQGGWERWWRVDKGADDVRYVQFMGKDNVPFHTLGFPATIIGASREGAEPWKLVDYIKGLNYLNYDGGKFSTSDGRGVFMDQALEILPADYWRWWLMSNVPEGSDSNFTWESFQTGVNSDLADVLGNFVSRVTKFARARFGDRLPEGGDYGPAEIAVAEDLSRRVRAYEGHMESIELRKATHELRAIWVAGNEYLQSAAPWTAIKTDPDRAAAISRFAFNLIRLYAVLSAPFLPDAATAMLRAVGLETADWPEDVGAALGALLRRPCVRGARRSLREARRCAPRGARGAVFRRLSRPRVSPRRRARACPYVWSRRNRRAGPRSSSCTSP